MCTFIFFSQALNVFALLVCGRAVIRSYNYIQSLLLLLLLWLNVAKPGGNIHKVQHLLIEKCKMTNHIGFSPAPKNVTNALMLLRVFSAMTTTAAKTRWYYYAFIIFLNFIWSFLSDDINSSRKIYIRARWSRLNYAKNFIWFIYIY